MTAVDRTLESLELIKVVKEDTSDEVDDLKLVAVDGVECLIGDDFMDYEKNYGD